jgi:hypothetical protein
MMGLDQTSEDSDFDFLIQDDKIKDGFCFDLENHRRKFLHLFQF